MSKININVYFKLGDLEQINNFFAIKNDNVIEYIDLEKNKMIINIKDNKLIRENSDYIFNFDFNNNIINIYLKKMNKTIEKSINTLLIDKTNKRFLVRYQLIDEDIINEYLINF